MTPDAEAAIEEAVLYLETTVDLLSAHGSEGAYRESMKRVGAAIVADRPAGVWGIKAGSEAKWLVAAARAGDSYADFALRIAGAELIEAGRTIPPDMRDYIAAILLAGPELKARRRGRDARQLAARNVHIGVVVFNAVLHGFDETRGRATKDKEAGESACSIAAKALAKVGVNMDESNVETIWAGVKPHLDWPRASETNR